MGPSPGRPRRRTSSPLARESQLTLWGHASRVPGRGWRGAVPPLTPPTATARRERWTRRLGEDPRQRGGACRVAREGARRRAGAVGSGAPLDRGARRGGARAHPRTGADRGEPEPDHPLGQHRHLSDRGPSRSVAHLLAIEAGARSALHLPVRHTADPYHRYRA